MSSEKCWPTEIPDELQGLDLEFSACGKFIICKACEKYDTRKNSSHGKVHCARDRFFKFCSIKEHVTSTYHKEAVKKCLKDEDAKKMNPNEYKKKHGVLPQKRKKVTKIDSFFSKKTSNNNNINNSQSTSIRATPPSNLATIDLLDDDSSSSSSYNDDNEKAAAGSPSENTNGAAATSSPERINYDYKSFLVTHSLVPNTCLGAYAHKDLKDNIIQCGLKAQSLFYNPNPDYTVKKIGSTQIYSVFSNKCPFGAVV